MLKTKKNRKISGFTLLEYIIAMGLTVGIFFAVFSFGQGIFSWNRSAQENLGAQSSARKVLKVMVRELRSASPSSLGAYPIALASSSALTFFSNIDDDIEKEQIRYFFNGSSLMKGVIKPSGSPLVYNSDDEKITTLITDINNGVTPIFDYFDANYTGTSSPLVQPVQATSVRLIRVTIKIEKNPAKSLGPFQIETQVFLRNLKDNL